MPLDDDIAASRASRQAPKMQELDAELDGMLATQNAPKVQSPLPPVPAGLQAPPRKDPTFTSEAVRAVGGGIRDAGQNMLDLAHDLGTWTGEHLLGLRMASGPESRINLPKVSENQTAVGKIGRSLTQFIVPFLGASKAIGLVAPAMGTITKGLAAGAVTDAAAFDPREKRLSNLVLEMTNNDPAFGKEAFEYLAANPEDTNAEGRFKNAIEGMGLGVAVEGLVKGFKLVKAHYTAKGQRADEVIQKEAQDSAKNQAEADKAIKEYDAKAEAKAMPLRDQIDILTGVNKKATPDYNKRLDVVAAVKDVSKAANSTPHTDISLRNQIDQATGVSRSSDSTARQADVEAAVAAETPAERFARINSEVAAGKSHRAVWDDAEGSVVFTKEPPKPGEIPLSQRVLTSLGKAPHERTAQDLITLRAYRQLQDAAFPGLAKAGDNVPPATNGKPLEVVTSRARKGTDEGTGGATKAATDIADDIKAKELEIAKAMSKPQNSALTDPSVLAQMAAAPAAGGIAGASSGNEDDDFATKLTLGLGAALAVYGIKARVGKSKVLTPAEREVISNPDPVVQSLARTEVANIAPVDPALVTKKVPPIRADKVNQMVSDAVSGNYKAVAQAMKDSDFNFDRIDTAEDVKQMVDGFSSVFEKEIDKATHGTQTFKQTQELADELGAGKATMKQMYEGTDNLAARVLAHRSLLSASAEKVTSLAKLAMTGDADAILALRKHVALHAAIQAQMKGVQTEIARALGQFRITSKSVDLAVNERNELIEAMGGHKANMEFAQKLADISDPTKLNAVVRKSAMARTKDAMFEGWINGLLSGPATHVVNMVGNSLTALNSVAERGTAAMIGKVLRTDDAIQTGEVKAQLFGMVEGLKDAVSITNEGLQAVRASAGQAMKGDLKGAAGTLADNSNEFGGAWQAAATGNPVLDNAAFATSDALARGPSITAQNFDLDPNSIVGGVVDGLGALVRLPSRALVASDELFKTVHYRGELKAQAYRMARSEGLEGEALFKRVGQLVEDPTPTLRSQALTAARQGTFTSPLGSRGASLQNLIQNIPGARYVMPFVRTPINLMKFVGVRTPGLNLLADSVRAEFKAGGVRRDVMLAKTAMGGAMYALGAHLAAEGHITGGGEKDQAAEKLGGIQAYSIKVGDKYYAFNRFDPFGAFLGIAADLSDISGHISADEMDQVASAATLALSRNLVSKTYLSGLVDLIDTINSGSEAKWQKYMQRQAGTIVPSGVDAVRREVDPEVKEVWSMIDAIKARLPGYSKDVPPLVNIFGEDVHYKGGLGPDIASPIYTSEKTTEPAAAEIARLNLDLRHPSRTIAASSGGKGIDLSPKQYYKYMKLIGNDTKIVGVGFKDYMTHLVQSDFYKNLPEDPTNNTYVEAKEMVIKKAFDAYKKAATMQLVESDPELKQMWIQNKQNAANALTGRPVLKLQK